MIRSSVISALCFFTFIWQAEAQYRGIMLTTEGGEIFELNTEGDSCSYLKYRMISCLDTTNYSHLFSVALYKDTLYANDINGNLYRSVDGTNSYCILLRNEVYSEVLTVDNSGNLFWISNADSLVRYNPQTDKTSYLGVLNFIPAGDLIFFQNMLLMSSADGRIININIDHPELSVAFMQTPGHLFYGLASIITDCTQHDIFGFEKAGTNTNVIELDVNSKKVLRTYCTLPFVVSDAASENESGNLACNCQLYIPNAFSPNNDGTNDYFRPIIRCSTNAFLSQFLFRIFNRWGQLVFSTTDLHTGWNGAYSGKQQEEGTYIWEIIYKNGLSDNEMIQRGSFILIK